MSTPNRAAILTKMHKVLKKHYKPVAAPADRLLLEHLLYACCLENARHEVADEAFAKLQESYFDWNEVRVTTVSELAEIMAALPDPVQAATRLRRSLHSVFETHYSFDLEHLRKLNLGKAVKELQSHHGMTDFTVAYVTQNGLGGHAIPVNQGALEALVVVGVISEAEAKAHRVPGMERAIPKSKGLEFAALLHQLGADFHSAPFSNRVRGILLEIAPDAKNRFPKRAAKKSTAAKRTIPGKASGTRAGKKKVTPSKKTAAEQGASKAKKAKRPPAKKKTATAAKKSSTKRLTRKKPR